MTFENLAGQRFGKLVCEVPTRCQLTQALKWCCQCDCGEMAIVVPSSLKSGKTTSCGCVRRANGAKQFKKRLAK